MTQKTHKKKHRESNPDSSPPEKSSKKRKSEDETIIQEPESENKQIEKISKKKKRAKLLENDLDAPQIIQKGDNETDHNFDGKKTTDEHTDSVSKSDVEALLEDVALETETKKKPKKKKKDKNKEKNAVPEEKAEAIPRKERALQYLQTWTSNRGSWKFNKMLQVYLLQGMYDQSKLSDDDFNQLLPYLEGMGPKSKSKTIEEAMKYLQEDSDTDETKGARVRQLLKYLS